MRNYLTKRNILVLLTVLFFLIAWNRSINLLYGMFALLSAVLILSHVLPRYSLRGVIASRTLPSSAFEGDRVEITVDVRNNGSMDRSMIEVVDAFPAAEPGSQKPMSFIARLARKKNRRYSYTMACYKRGEYRVGPLMITSSYPLGISTAKKEMTDSDIPFLVYPEVFDIAALPLISASTAPMSGVEAASKAGGTEEFFGTREYRQGDSLRYIHWPSTARHSQMIVKEFEVRSCVQVTIVIDLQKGSDIGAGKETTLEYAVKIAASTAKYSLDRGHAAQLVCFGETEHIVPAAGGHFQLARILETLAKVRADGSISYAQAVNRASELMREGEIAILIFSESRLRGPDLVYSFNLLKARRIRTMCVMLDDASFSTHPEGEGHSNSPRVIMADGMENYRISRGDSLRGVFAP